MEQNPNELEDKYVGIPQYMIDFDKALDKRIADTIKPDYGTRVLEVFAWLGIAAALMWLSALVNALFFA